MVTYTNDGCARDKGTMGTNFTCTNYTADYDMDCNTGTLGVVADTLATVIRELIQQGILKGSVAS